VKTVLLITYFFPPQTEAGALRPFYLGKYLKDYGWDVSIVTPPAPPPGASPPAPRGEAAAFKRILRKWPAFQILKNVRNSLVYFPDAARSWIPQAVREANARFRSRRIDALISTALPGSAHIIGAIVAKQQSAPWIADYRDLWTENPYRPFGHVRNSIERSLEVSVLRRAAAITTVSAAFAASLSLIHGRDDIDVIPNAGDPQDWQGISDLKPAAFSLCYAGRLYKGKRSPDLLFAAMAALRKAGDPAGLSVRFDFYGPEGEIVHEAASRHGVADLVFVHGVVSRQLVLEAERASAALVLLLRDDEAVSDEYGSKIFEYAGAKRPVIALGRSGSVLQTFLDRTGLGIFVSTADECAAGLRRLYERYRRGEFEPEYREGWSTFTAPALAERFAAVLDRICSQA